MALEAGILGSIMLAKKISDHHKEKKQRKEDASNARR
jgi:hypothetical protein